MTYKTLFLMLNLFLGLFLMQRIQSEPVEQVQKNNRSITLELQNMTCPMCKFTIKKALNQVVGVQEVTVNSDTETAFVLFDPQKTNHKEIIKATTNVGYPAIIRHAK